MCRWLVYALLILVAILKICKSTHVFKVDRDFSKVKSDTEVAKHVEEVLRKLRTFKVAVHPRVRLLYRLLKRGMARHAYRVSDSLYVPYVYRANNNAES
ncbi:unnamed protein product, partial [Iphiclides podalirius]